MFLNLLYKSLKADVSLRRIKAFAKRLLHVSTGQSAGFACGALFLLSEVMKAKPGLRTLLQQDEVTRLHLLPVHTRIVIYIVYCIYRGAPVTGTQVRMHTTAQALFRTSSCVCT